MSLTLPEGTVSQTSASMLQAARDNDPEAWRRLVDGYSRRIYRWCRQSGVPAEAAADVVQEVFHCVARKLTDFRHDRAGDTFRGWLYTITRNKVRDHFGQRACRRERARGGTDAQRTFLQLAQPESAAAVGESEGRSGSPERQRLIDRVRAEFSQRDWRLFWRVVVDGQTAAEAGREHDMSANAVRLVKMRILRRFRELAATESKASDKSLFLS